MLRRIDAVFGRTPARQTAHWTPSGGKIADALNGLDQGLEFIPEEHDTVSESLEILDRRCGRDQKILRQVLDPAPAAAIVVLPGFPRLGLDDRMLIGVAAVSGQGCPGTLVGHVHGPRRLAPVPVVPKVRAVAIGRVLVGQGDRPGPEPMLPAVLRTNSAATRPTFRRGSTVRYVSKPRPVQEWGCGAWVCLTVEEGCVKVFVIAR